MHEYSSIMQEATAVVRTFMAKRGLNQLELSQVSGVSQPTISRTLRGRAKRRGQARAKLFTYITNELAAEAEGLGKERVVKAFEGIWDGTEAHASAVAKVINALSGLRPIDAREE